MHTDCGFQQVPLPTSFYAWTLSNIICQQSVTTNGDPLPATPHDERHFVTAAFWGKFAHSPFVTTVGALISPIHNRFKATRSGPLTPKTSLVPPLLLRDTSDHELRRNFPPELLQQ